MSQQQPPDPPTQPAGWGPPPPPPRPKSDRLPWYQRFWWAIALGALLLGVMIAGAAEPQSETRTVTQVSEKPTFTAECDTIENQNERRQCERVVAGYEKSLQGPETTAPPPTTTTAPKPKPTQPPAATIEDGTWAVPDEVKPGTYVSDGGSSCYWARLRDLEGGLNSIIANSISPGRQRVSIRRPDAAFETSGCPTWRKVG
jgi:hypothetical protein